MTLMKPQLTKADSLLNGRDSLTKITQVLPATDPVFHPRIILLTQKITWGI